MSVNLSENSEIKLFQEYLRIRTDHPNVDCGNVILFGQFLNSFVYFFFVLFIEPCVKFLLSQATDLGIESKVFRPHSPTKPIVVLTWIGTHPDLPSILLNSHMDVVPVNDKFWSHPPFAAEITDDGKIYARGSQDMKSVGMSYLAAIRKLKQRQIRLKRTMHLIYTPDEEIGGFHGMNVFVKTKDFEALNICFGLDEGMANPINEFSIFYGERFGWGKCIYLCTYMLQSYLKFCCFFFFVVIRFKCNGNTGHVSLFLENTAIQKVHFLLDKFLKFRDNEQNRLKENSNLTNGDVTTVNVVNINGGDAQDNVVPPEISLTVAIRLSVAIDAEQFERDIRRWCKEAGGDIDIEFLVKTPRIEPTKLDENNVFWMALKDAFENEM